MPEAVAYFTREENFKETRIIQQNILEAYDNDFSKHAPNELIPRIRMLWHSLPAQLSQENKKFVYGIVKKGARAREYERALEWLRQYGLTHSVERITKPGLPLKAYAEMNAFKLFALDVGLLGAMSELDEKVLLDKNVMFSEFKGALTEQYVLQQMIAEAQISPYYWSQQNSSGEIDFIFTYQNNFYPVEVKAEVNLRAKSLKYFSQKYRPKNSIRISLADYKQEDRLTNIPLYAVGEILNLIQPL